MRDELGGGEELVEIGIWSGATEPPPDAVAYAGHGANSHGGACIKHPVPTDSGTAIR